MLQIKEGDMGICGVDFFGCDDVVNKIRLNLRCCGDLKSYGVRW